MHTPAFDVPDVTWSAVSPRLVTVRQISAALWLGIPLVAFAVLAVLVGPGFWVGAAVAAALLLWSLWLIPRQVRAIGYAELADDLLIRKGVLYRTLTVIPYGRLQYVDVQAGPLVRRFGIAQVQLHTASASTDAAVPGLPEAEAARLRDQLSARGEARLAGL